MIIVYIGLRFHRFGGHVFRYLLVRLPFCLLGLVCRTINGGHLCVGEIGFRRERSCILCQHDDGFDGRSHQFLQVRHRRLGRDLRFASRRRL